MTTKKTVSLRIAAFILTAVLFVGMLSGCSAVIEDPVVAKVGSVKVNLSQYYSLYSSYAAYAPYMGYDTSTPEGLMDFQDWVLEQTISNAVLIYEAKEQGIELTEEDMQEAQKDADEAFASALKQYETMIPSSITDEIEKQNAELELFTEDLKTTGYTVESYKAQLLENAIDNMRAEKLIENVKAGASVTDEEVEKHYSDKLAEQKKNYEETPAKYYEDYTYYLNYGVESGYLKPNYIPEGYIRVKHIYIPYASEDDKTTDTEGTSTKKTEQEARDLIETIQGKLAEGADFDALIEEYGEDTGMETEPFKTEGYLVHESIIDKYFEGWAEAALALSEVGDYSEPFDTTDSNGGKGIHIIKLIEKVESTEISFDDAKEDIHAFLLKQAEDKLYSETLAGWVENAPIKRYTSRIRYVGLS